MRKLSYVCFTNFSGFAYAAKCNIEALLPYYDISVSSLDFGFNKKINSHNYDELVKLAQKPFDVTCVQVFHCLPDFQRRFRHTASTIGYGTFETTDPPKRWVEHYNVKNKALVVPSLFNLKIFKEAGVKIPIFYIPHCLDFNKYNLQVIPTFKSTKFRFLFMGAWKERKGYEILLNAFYEEFKADENVELVLKTNAIYGAKPELAILRAQKIANLGKYPEVKIDCNLLDDSDLPGYIKSFNCLVAPHSGEGFGLPGLQAMAVGVPIIITNYSGCQDYANTETAILLEPEGFVEKPCLDGVPQFLHSSWAYISVSQVREKMRKVYSDSTLCQEKVLKAYEFVKDRFNYERCYRDFEEMLKSIS
jgi:glycosyltransferase involved in cell wall biosynthesis